MAKQHARVKVLESCRVALPPNSVGESSIRLTFFDIIWLQQPPVERLFFYKLPPTIATTTHFQTSLLPQIKLSLSLALHLFYPLAGNLILTRSTHHEILYKPGDSVSLTVAESDSDFLHLSGNHPRDDAELHPLLPHLPPCDALPTPVLALQVTHFPSTGICIGISVHHVAADGWSSSHFMKSWASICRSGDPTCCVASLPVYDRTETIKLDWITRNYYREMEKVSEPSVEEVQAREPLVRATFVLRRAHVEGLRKMVLASRRPAHVSSFSLACSYVWCTLIRARDGDDEEEEKEEREDGNKSSCFAFAVDCRSRLDPPIPVTYLGNCIGGCFAEAKRGNLRREDGIVFAAEAIGKAIRGLEGEGVLQGAESWGRRVVEVARGGVLSLSVAGSPRFRVYETDFGWGKAEKVEVISIEGAGAMIAMSLAESREEEGGLEVGLARPKRELIAFASLFERGILSPFGPKLA